MTSDLLSTLEGEPNLLGIRRWIDDKIKLELIPFLRNHADIFLQ